MCYPCADIVPTADRINSWKPFANGTWSSQGYWRIIPIGVGSSFQAQTGSQTLLQDVSFDPDLYFSVTWSELANVQSQLLTEMCDLTEMHPPIYPLPGEYQFPGYYYCGEIVALFSDIDSSSNSVTSGYVLVALDC
jgi:hypothetical protein